jgi:subtilisin family serine protease
MATPIVSGVAAILVDQNPGITLDQLKTKLMKAARRGFPAVMSTTVANSKGCTTVYSATEISSPSARARSMPGGVLRKFDHRLRGRPSQQELQGYVVFSAWICFQAYSPTLL